MSKLLPIQLLDSVIVFIAIALPYLLFAGLAFFSFYFWRKSKYWYLKIQQYYPQKKDVIREITYSCITIIIFSIVIIGVKWAGYNGFTRIYDKISDRGYVYYVFSIILMLVMQDTYFYWMHRLMHTKAIFKKVHLLHHLSTNPTPFAAYSFHPIEAVVQVAIVPIVAFTIPYHISAIIIFSVLSLLLNTLVSHMGFEILPKGIMKYKYLKWINPSTHHNMHHSNSRCNYGLYLNIWDLIMRTNHSKYDEKLEELSTLHNMPATNQG